MIVRYFKFKCHRCFNIELVRDGQAKKTSSGNFRTRPCKFCKPGRSRMAGVVQVEESRKHNTLSQTD